MNILILGYGKMGKYIDQLAQKRGHQIAGRIDNKEDLSKVDAEAVDVAIEFSQPEAAYDNITFCLENSIPIVCGTTGWLDKKADVENKCKRLNGTFFYASNFSVGVNLFFKLNEKLAAMMAQFDNYAPSIKEIHHIHKKDAPSGTAISLAEGLMKFGSKYENWSLEGDDEDTLHIEAIRENEVPGTHSIKYTSDVDDIEITHTAHSREGFAMGAVLVAEWIKDKEGVLSMDDFLKI